MNFINLDAVGFVYCRHYWDRHNFLNLLYIPAANPCYSPNEPILSMRYDLILVYFSTIIIISLQFYNSLLYQKIKQTYIRICLVFPKNNVYSIRLLYFNKKPFYFFFFYGNKNSNWFQITLITKMLIQYYQEVLKKENSSIWNSKYCKDLES